MLNAITLIIALLSIMLSLFMLVKYNELNKEFTKFKEETETWQDFTMSSISVLNETIKELK